MNIEYKSSILLSIFKRKGAEGIFTKIITEENKEKYEYVFSGLLTEEEIIIISFENFFNWTLLTNKGIIYKKENLLTRIFYQNIESVSLDLKTEMTLGNRNKAEFTYLLLQDVYANSYSLRLEKGEPFQGIYQLLGYIVLCNHHNNFVE